MRIFFLIRPSPSTLTRVMLIGAILLSIIVGLAFASGWLSPGRLSPGEMVDSLQSADGLHR